MSSGDTWDDPARVQRYRDRVFGERESLRAALADASVHQQRVLTELLDFNAGTEYGRAHSFGSIRSLDDFRKAVPINDYAALAPWIDRMAAGESNLLSADDPAVYFTSSGTTGDHKKIPVTPRFMQRTFFPFYYAAWAPLIEHFPDVLGRPDAVLNLKHDPRPAPRPPPRDTPMSAPARSTSAASSASRCPPSPAPSRTGAPFRCRSSRTTTWRRPICGCASRWRAMCAASSASTRRWSPPCPTS